MNLTFKRLFDYKSWSDAELIAAIGNIDGEKHAPLRHTAIRLMNHIRVVDEIFIGHLRGTPHGHTATNTTDTPTLDALAVSTQACDEWLAEHASGLDGDQLAEVVMFAFTDGDTGQMTREEMLLHLATHGGYHRGAIGRILVQAGLTPPRDLYTRFLHTTEPERREIGL